MTGSIVRRAFRSRTGDGAVDVTPVEQSATMTLGADATGAVTTAGKATEAAETVTVPELVVCASGNLGLVYFPRRAGPADVRGHRSAVAGPRRRALDASGNWVRDGPHRGSGADRGRRAWHQLPAGRLRDGRRPGRTVRRTLVRRPPAGRRHGALPRHPRDLHARPLDRRGRGVRGADRVARRARWPADEAVHPPPVGLDGRQPIVGAEAVYDQIRTWMASIDLMTPPRVRESAIARTAAAGAGGRPDVGPSASLQRLPSRLPALWPTFTGTGARRVNPPDLPGAGVDRADRPRRRAGAGGARALAGGVGRLGRRLAAI